MNLLASLRIFFFRLNILKNISFIKKTVFFTKEGRLLFALLLVVSLSFTSLYSNRIGEYFLDNNTSTIFEGDPGKDEKIVINKDGKPLAAKPGRCEGNKLIFLHPFDKNKKIADIECPSPSDVLMDENKVDINCRDMILPVVKTPVAGCYYYEKNESSEPEKKDSGACSAAPKSIDEIKNQINNNWPTIKDFCKTYAGCKLVVEGAIGQYCSGCDSKLCTIAKNSSGSITRWIESYFGLKFSDEQTSDERCPADDNNRNDCLTIKSDPDYCSTEERTWYLANCSEERSNPIDQNGTGGNQPNQTADNPCIGGAGIPADYTYYCNGFCSPATFCSSQGQDISCPTGGGKPVCVVKSSSSTPPSGGGSVNKCTAPYPEGFGSKAACDSWCKTQPSPGGPNSVCDSTCNACVPSSPTTPGTGTGPSGSTGSRGPGTFPCNGQSYGVGQCPEGYVWVCEGSGLTCKPSGSTGNTGSIAPNTGSTTPVNTGSTGKCSNAMAPWWCPTQQSCYSENIGGCTKVL